MNGKRPSRTVGGAAKKPKTKEQRFGRAGGKTQSLTKYGAFAMMNTPRKGQGAVV